MRGRRPADLEFEAFMRPHLDTVFGRAYALTGSTPDGEDLTQEVCIRASARFGELVDHDNPRAWLLRVLYRLFVDLVRSRRRSPIRLIAGDELERSLEAAASTEPGPEQQAEASTFFRRLRLAWLRLSDEEQLLLALHGIEGLSLTEIQEVTGLRLGTIKSRLHRSRRRLGRLLQSAELTHTAGKSSPTSLGEISNAL